MFLVNNLVLRREMLSLEKEKKDLKDSLWAGDII